MFATPEHVSALNVSTLDTALQFAKISVDATERLFNLGIDAGREAANEAAKSSKAYGDVKSFQDLLASQSKVAEISVEKAVALSKTFYEVTQKAQKEVASIFESKLSEFSKALTSNLEIALQSAPVGADAAVSALKSSVAAGTAAFDSMTKAAKQAASMAEANVQAAVEAATPRAKAAKAK